MCDMAERQADYTELLRERLEADREAVEQQTVRRVRFSKTDVGDDPWWWLNDER